MTVTSRVAESSMIGALCTASARKKDFLVRCLHFLVSCVGTLAAVVGLIHFLTSDFDWTAHEYLSYVVDKIHWLFSVWASVIQMTYFNIYFILDVVGTYEKDKDKLDSLSQKLHSLAGYILFSLVLPLTSVVTVIFWTVFLWDREVIMPAMIDAMIPPVLNHMMHTFPLIFVLLYMFIENEREPPKRKTLPVLLAFIALYSAISVTVKRRFGKWLYYFQEFLTPLQLSCFFAFVILGLIGSFFLGYRISNEMRRLRLKLSAFIKKNH